MASTTVTAALCTSLILFTSLQSVHTVALGQACSNAILCTAANSECVASLCSCKGGFKWETGVCNKVSGSACTGNNDCPTNSSSTCVGNVGAQKCTCITDYEEKNSVCTKKVTATTCSNNGAQCAGIPNSVCETTKCKCVAGYKEDVDICSKVSGSECTDNTTCPADSNTFCLGNPKTCTCKTGYAEKNGICTLKVTATTCTNNGAQCAGISNSVCEASNCKCVPGYKEEVDICSKEVGQACKEESECVSNSECVATKCTCKAGFEPSNGLCVESSTSSRLQIATGTLVGSMLLSLYVFVL